MFNKIILILISFISSTGDALFLTGVPMFLYESSGKSVAPTAFFIVAINLTVYLSRNFISKIQNRFDAVNIVTFGEISMAVLEIVILYVYWITQNYKIFYLSIFPLALAYNLYAVPKFYQIQDKFNTGDVVKFTGLLSLFRELGVLLGIFLSGYIITKYSIYELVVFDIFSFLTFGVGILFLKIYSNSENVSKVKAHKLELSKIEQKKIESNFDLKISIFLYCSMLSSFFFSWQQATLLPFINKAYHLDLSIVSSYRFSFGIIGGIVGYYFVLIFRDILEKTWVSLLILLILCSLLPFFLSAKKLIAVIFTLFAILKTVSESRKKEFYDRVSVIEQFKNFAILQWSTETLYKLSLLPLAYTIDFFFKYGKVHEPYLMILYMIFIIILSIVSGKLFDLQIKKGFPNQV